MSDDTASTGLTSPAAGSLDPWEFVADGWSAVLGRASRGDVAPLIAYLTAVVVLEGLPVIDLVALFPPTADRYAGVVADDASELYRSEVAGDLDRIARHLSASPSSWRSEIGPIVAGHAARTSEDASYEPAVPTFDPSIRYVILAVGEPDAVVLVAAGTPAGISWIGRAPAGRQAQGTMLPGLLAHLDVISSAIVGPRPPVSLTD